MSIVDKDITKISTTNLLKVYRRIRFSDDYSPQLVSKIKAELNTREHVMTKGRRKVKKQPPKPQLTLKQMSVKQLKLKFHKCRPYSMTTEQEVFNELKKRYFSDKDEYLNDLIRYSHVK
jgi:hypothetical protein